MTKKTNDQKLLPTIFKDFGQFFNDLFSGVFFRTIGQDLRDLREFYLDKDRKQRLERMSFLRSWIVIIFWLLKETLLKLSSFHRILFLLACTLIVSAAGRGDNDQNKIILGLLAFTFILMLELKDKLLARQELAAGRAVQRALSPDHSPQVDGWDLWLYSMPANDVGGDLVDIIPIDGKRFGLVIGDVAGKGLGAALFMAKLQASLRALVLDYLNPVELVEKLNRIFYRDTIASNFASMVYLEIEPGSGKIRFVNAGHLPPVLIQGKDITEMRKGSQALGLIREVNYAEDQVWLKSGDYFLIYSDGLSEAMNREGEFYGETRIQSLAAKFGTRSSLEAGEAVLQDVSFFSSGAVQSDDLSLIILKRL